MRAEDPWVLPSGARATGKGSVLLRMYDSYQRDVEAAKKYLPVISLGFPLAGVVLVVVGIFLIPMLEWLSFVTIIPVLIGVLLLVVGVWLGPKLRRFLKEGFPLTIYENGVEWYHLTRGPEFVPWGQLTSAEEMDVMKTKVLALKKGEQWVGSIPTDVEGYDRVAPIIKERVGKAEYDVDVRGPDVGVRSAERKGRDVKYTTSVAVMSLVMGVAGATYTANDWVTFEGEGWMHLLLLTAVPMTLGTYLMIMWFAMGRDFYGGWTKRVDLRPVVAFVVALLIAFTAVYYVAPDGISIPGEEIRSTTDPPPSALEVRYYRGEELNVSGPVTVSRGEVLTLVNSTLRFSPSPGNRYGLWVGPGGTLTAVNSTITCSDLSVGYTFEVHGSAQIVDSRIEGTNADPAKVNGEGGFEVYSDEVRVENTTFADALSAAVMTVDCSPVFEGCTFVDVLDEGVEAHGGRPVLRNCTFQRCAWPMILWSSDALIEECSFSDCPTGIHMYASDPEVHYCTFEHIDRYAVKHTVDSEPDLVGNIFLGVGVRVSVDYTWAGIEWSCVVGTYIAGIVVLVAMVRWNAGRPPWEEEEEKDQLEDLLNPEG